jgi:hypothetical protein
MLSSDMSSMQTRLTELEYSKSMSVFTPPGIFVEAAKYPTLWTGVLASTEPSEHLSIHDFPGAWRGLGLETILMMREQLYRFVLPIDARLKEPGSDLELIQSISLSVSPVALSVEVDSLPPRNLQIMGTQLPYSPLVPVKRMELVSEPEISQVALKITEDDIPSTDAIWKLVDFEYSLDQISKFMSVGLLGRMNNRRLVPTRAAYKAVIDTYINRAIAEIMDAKGQSTYRLQSSNLLGNKVTVVIQPGKPKVDYLRIEQFHGSRNLSYSFEENNIQNSDPKTSIYADQARFVIYKHLVENSIRAHVTIFHLNSVPRSNALGPWLVRAAVEDALSSEVLEVDTNAQMRSILEATLKPNLSLWAGDTPLVKRIGPKTEQLILT